MRNKVFIMLMLVSIFFSCRKEVLIETIPSGATIQYLDKEFVSPKLLVIDHKKFQMEIYSEGYNTRTISNKDIKKNHIIIELEKKQQHNVYFKFIYSNLWDEAIFKLDGTILESPRDNWIYRGEHEITVDFTLYKKTFSKKIIVDRSGDYIIDMKDFYNDLKLVQRKRFKEELLKGLSNELLTLSYWNKSGDYSKRFYFDLINGFYNIDGSKIGEYSINDNTLLLTITETEEKIEYKLIHDGSSWYIDDFLQPNNNRSTGLFPTSDWITDGEFRMIDSYEIVVIDDDYLVKDQLTILKEPDKNSSTVKYELKTTNQDEITSMQTVDYLMNKTEVIVMGTYTDELNIEWAYFYTFMNNKDTPYDLGFRVYGWCEFENLILNQDERRIY